MWTAYLYPLLIFLLYFWPCSYWFLGAHDTSVLSLLYIYNSSYTLSLSVEGY